MRIAHLFATLIAVLAAVVLPRSGAQEYNNSYSLRRTVRSLPPNNNSWDVRHSETHNGRGQRARQMQALIRSESLMGAPIDCCPTVEEMIEPLGAKNQNGSLVTLYSNGEVKQRFYEYSCRKDVVNKPCRFVQRELYNQSRCVQKFAFTYALVRDENHHHHRQHQHQHEHQRHQRHFGTLPNTDWTLDYIQVRSGCSCELIPKNNHRRHKQSQHKRRPQEPPPPHPEDPR